MLYRKPIGARFSALLWPLALASIVSTTFGCSVTVKSDAGRLGVDWTIEGETLRSDCVRTGSDYLNLVVFDRNDFLVADVIAPCEDFYVSVPLRPGRYFPDVTLYDAFDISTTLTLELDQVLVLTGEEIVVPADFFASDFY